MKRPEEMTEEELKEFIQMLTETYISNTVLLTPIKPIYTEVINPSLN